MEKIGENELVKIGLFYDRVGWEEKRLEVKAKEMGIDIRPIDAKVYLLDVHVEPKTLHEEFGEVVLQRCISHFRGLHLTAFLESKGIKVINSYKVAEVCGNKLLTTLQLVKSNIPTPKTIVSFTSASALDAVERLGYPAVLKPVTGSWVRLVAPLKDSDTATSIIEARELMNNPLSQIYYIQEYIHRPPRDIRCIVVGDEVITAYYRYAPPGDWRTNIARGGKAEPCKMTKELEDLALGAAEAVGNGVLAVDMMESDRGILVHEVNSRVEFRGASSVSNVDIAKAILEYAIREWKR
ncbi:MAG: lysine biosynthesis protein LysX [Nitrososphaerales archaeon]|nr:lysine biosynthesis protein LysX [Nitrososphaerales archaeon]